MVIVPVISANTFDIMKTNEFESQVLGGIEICLNNGQNGKPIINSFIRRGL